MERESNESLEAHGERRGRVVFNRDADSTEAHLYLLPWIGLRDPVRFGDVEVAPAPICLDPSQPYTAAARRILDCYRGLRGSPFIPCLMWIDGRGPLEVTESDYETLRRHRICLSAALIMSNSYYDITEGLSPICDAHCEGYFHHFQSDVKYINVSGAVETGAVRTHIRLKNFGDSPRLGICAASAQHRSIALGCAGDDYLD